MLVVKLKVGHCTGSAPSWNPRGEVLISSFRAGYCMVTFYCIDIGMINVDRLALA